MLQSLDDDARKELTPLKLRNKAAKFAKSTVQSQMASFKVVYILLLFILYSFIIDLLLFLSCYSSLFVMLTSMVLRWLQRYGVWADWDQHYLTLHPEYEAAQVCSQQTL